MKEKVIKKVKGVLRSKEGRIALGVAFGILLIAVLTFYFYSKKAASEEMAYMNLINEQLGTLFPEPARNEIMKQRLLEDVAKRGEFAKHFPRGDGSYIAIISTAPLHYFDKASGQWKNIDLTIKEISAGDFKYANLTNTLKTYFSEPSQNSNSLFRVETDEVSISWKPERILYRNEKGEEEVIAEFNNSASVSFQGNMIQYTEIFPNVDNKIEIRAGEIKDNIIIKKPLPSPHINGEISFIIEGSLVTEGIFDASANGINITNEKIKPTCDITFLGNGEETLRIKGLRVFDSAENRCREAHYLIKKENIAEKKEYTLEISIPYSWFNSGNIKFPVNIDPSVTKYVADDTFVVPCDPNTNFCSETSILVGYARCDGWGGPYRGLIKFENFVGCGSGKIPLNSYINNAFFYIVVGSAVYLDATRNIYVYGIDQDWSCGSVTWNNKPTYNSSVYDWAGSVSKSDAGYWKIFDVESTVQDWVNEYDSVRSYRGFYLIGYEYSDYGNEFVLFYSNDSNWRPYLEINYTPPCSSGPCCDSYGCFRSSSYICNTWYEYDCVAGTSCGADVYRRQGTQYCSGSSSNCNGQIVYSSWTVYQNCSTSQYCDPSSLSCQSQCSSGPCCDGCRFKPSGTSCDDGNSCTTGDYCNGSSAQCQPGTPQCTSGQCCNTSTGCFKPSGTSCDDGNSCTSGDYCNGSSAECQAGSTVDNDSDGYPPNNCGGGDCNDNDPNINPGKLEVCDGKDNNCDGQTDEGCSCNPGDTQRCGTTDVGECEYGTQTCQSNGTWGSCVGNIDPVSEVCGDGKDNDCDGQTDEECTGGGGGDQGGGGGTGGGGGGGAGGGDQGGGGGGYEPEEKGGCGCHYVNGGNDYEVLSGWIFLFLFTFIGIELKRRIKK